ncbi:hypothetical protein [Gellertiella hungarica]|uniref:Lipoprotein n=1 Tax=Gellertiella hungarica TaxID=1572859 RepID=A0A7W6J450_9HYPH|nr:hypothetical protein [Gellertiella hungarica]MBB4064459.1 hypothetical protein [Gellertiella hungarica]
MTGKVQAKMRMGAAMTAVLLAVAGCNTPTTTPFDHGNKAPGMDKPSTAKGAPAPVVTGTCPQISLREGTAFLRKGGKGKNGAPDDQAKLQYQVSLADTTRQCTMDESGTTKVMAMAQGRIVLGPMGKAGTFTLPIRVAVVDGDKTVYSELVKFNTELAAGQPSGQFLFQKEGIVLPPGTSGTARIFLGFDEGPYNTK